MSIIVGREETFDGGNGDVRGRARLERTIR